MIKGFFPIDVFQFYSHQESDVFNLKYDQNNGTNNVFVDTFVDSGACLPIDFFESLIFDDPLAESSDTCQEVESLQLMLMVT